MAKSAADLKAEFERLETKAIEIGAKADEQRQANAEKIRAANEATQAAQKAWLDAEAAEALEGRPDGYAVAESVGLVGVADDLGVELGGDTRDE